MSLHLAAIEEQRCARHLEQDLTADIPRVDFNQLRIDELIGTGGFCEVYAVRLLSSKPSGMALKIIRPEVAANDSMAESAKEDLINEAVVLSRLPSHPNVVQVRWILAQ